MTDTQTIKNFISNMQTKVDKIQKSGNSTFYPTTISAQKNVKCGWLKKQGGVVKSWKRRWFALKGDQLYYFLTEDENKPPQGVIPLPGNDVIEVPLNLNKQDEYLFEIIPGNKGKMNPTHDSYLICAASDDERKAWVQVIKRIIFSKLGGAIFGQFLEETLCVEQRKQRQRQRKVPEIITSCVEFLMTHGLEVEGIFRLPGRTSLIRELKEKYDRGERPVLIPEEHDVQTVASLLKLYLRELPEPLLPTSLYEAIMHQANRDFRENPDKAIEKLSEIMTHLPAANYNVLQYITNFLHEIAKYSHVNKMTEMNLATVFVQSVIRPEDEDPTLLMATASNRTQTVFLLINKHHDIFKIEYSAQGSLIAVDNLLDIGEEQYEEKPFSATTDSGIYASVVDSTSCKSFSEEVFDNIESSVSPSTLNNNLPQPLSPLSKAEEEKENRVGARSGRVFKDYLDRNSVSEDEIDGHYTEVDKTSYPVRSLSHDDIVNSGEYSNASNDNYYVEQQQQSNHHGENENGYSCCSKEEVTTRPKVSENRAMCESISSIDDDYSSLADYTSLLRRKSSQMYKEDGDNNDNTNGTSNHATTPQELYRNALRKSPSKQSNESVKHEDKKENVPPIPPKRPPIPSPRRSIKAQSAFFEQLDTKSHTNHSKVKPHNIHSKPLVKAQSVDTVLEDFSKNDSNILSSKRLNSDTSISSSQGGSVKSRNYIYELISVDLSGASREELMTHIEILHSELLDQNEKMSELKKSGRQNLQEMAEKLDKEKTATQGAVDKVIELQKTIERYQMKFGSMHVD